MFELSRVIFVNTYIVFAAAIESAYRISNRFCNRVGCFVSLVSVCTTSSIAWCCVFCEDWRLAAEDK